MSVLVRVDHAIIDYLYQPIANALSRITKPRDLALFCLMGDIVGTLVSMFIAYSSGRSYVGFAVGAFLLPTIYLGASRRPDTTSKMGNPMRIIPFAIYIRIISLTLMLEDGVDVVLRGVDAIVLMSFCSFFLYVCFLYFEACNAPPPSEQRKTVDNYAWSRT